MKIVTELLRLLSAHWLCSLAKAEMKAALQNADHYLEHMLINLMKKIQNLVANNRVTSSPEEMEEIVNHCVIFVVYYKGMTIREKRFVTQKISYILIKQCMKEAPLSANVSLAIMREIPQFKEQPDFEQLMKYLKDNLMVRSRLGCKSVIKHFKISNNLHMTQEDATRKSMCLRYLEEKILSGLYTDYAKEKVDFEWKMNEQLSEWKLTEQPSNKIWSTISTAFLESKWVPVLVKESDRHDGFKVTRDDIYNQLGELEKSQSSLSDMDKLESLVRLILIVIFFDSESSFPEKILWLEEIVLRLIMKCLSEKIVLSEIYQIGLRYLEKFELKPSITEMVVQLDNMIEQTREVIKKTISERFRLNKPIIVEGEVQIEVEQPIRNYFFFLINIEAFVHCLEILYNASLAGRLVQDSLLIEANSNQI
ncbi:hypothetical protein Ciccas_013607 [Cichlidogyrus casuarinus]|uniref:Uncharacterized protein n=1 Tax=Cichlidogyrus casuarinus TaxID=1844966 RepID=A0ABD2PKW6_9PLAT